LQCCGFVVIVVAAVVFGVAVGVVDVTAVHCKKSRRFSRRVNSRVADFCSKPAYSKQQWQPDWLGQAGFIVWFGGCQTKLIWFGGRQTKLILGCRLSNPINKRKKKTKKKREKKTFLTGT
jgi:hypothetical protein